MSWFASIFNGCCSSNAPPHHTLGPDTRPLPPPKPPAPVTPRAVPIPVAQATIVATPAAPTTSAAATQTPIADTPLQRTVVRCPRRHGNRLPRPSAPSAPTTRPPILAPAPAAAPPAPVATASTTSASSDGPTQERQYTLDRSRLSAEEMISIFDACTGGGPTNVMTTDETRNLTVNITAHPDRSYIVTISGGRFAEQPYVRIIRNGGFGHSTIQNIIQNSSVSRT